MRPVLWAVAAVLSSASVPAAQANPSPTDKTLVVWAAPANLTQRGGSALTLDDMKSHFDGIVLGELAPGRWMAGSDFWRRSGKGQGGYPAETADANTFVQVAIVYRGRQVTIYRNGKVYAGYTIQSAPQAFGPESVVMMGRRHIEAADTKCFAGAIDDARIYNAALDAGTIAALKPNRPSDPKPWAWWTFDEGRATDRTGRFGSTLLKGGARVADGRLWLDGKDGTLIAARTGQVDRWLAAQAKGSAAAGAIDTVRAFREQLLADPYRPTYHFTVPEGYCMPFDPNGAIFWKGRYHLFYIFQDKRGHNWGHASSTDLCHWRHHPTGLVGGMFSGNAFINKDGRPTMCYHQVGQGNAMAVALDDDLNRWEKPAWNPITPKTEPGDAHHGKYRSWDPYGWVEGDTYYAIFGGKRPAVVKSKALEGPWQYVGDLMANAVEGVDIHEDVSCADFFEIGGRRMLLCISHRLGSRYYLGRWEGEQFHPQFHARMSWVDNEFFAPESLLDAKGRRIMWAWIFDRRSGAARKASGWSGTMCLPRVLSLGDDGMLRMRPPEELKMLRYNGRTLTDLTVKADRALPLPTVRGNRMELAVRMVSAGAKQFGVKVCCSPDGQEQTRVFYDAAEQKLKVDTRQSSVGEGPKKVEAGPLALKAGEPLALRVYVDKSVVEVFANGRQAVARRIYPSRSDSVGVALFADGGPVKVPSVEAWEMMASNPY